MDSSSSVSALTALAELAGGGTSKSPASEELTQGFKPIEGLKPGDQVVYNGGAPIKNPKKGDVGTVCRVFSPPLRDSASSFILENDFSMLLVDKDDKVLEYAMDSRYFRRKE